MTQHTSVPKPADDGSTRSFSGKVHLAAATLLDRYPLATLIDIYKSFFQDEFGPGHLLHDETAALAYLDQEIESTMSRRRYEPELCGLGRRYCRLSLDLVVDGIVNRERLAQAFLRGAAGFTGAEVETWSGKWTAIRTALDPLRHRIAEFDESVRRIDDRLQGGRYVMHHSKPFRKVYDPHYRIVTIEDAKELVGAHG